MFFNKSFVVAPTNYKGMKKHLRKRNGDVHTITIRGVGGLASCRGYRDILFGLFAEMRKDGYEVIEHKLVQDSICYEKEDSNKERYLILVMYR